MICIKLLLVVFGCLVAGSQANPQVVNNSLAIDSADLVSNPCQDVRLGGFICVDCSTLGFCSHVDDQWQTVSITECQTERGFYCSDEGTFGCTWQPKCQVPVRGKFFCQSPGIFPDPYDCRNYHVCNEQNVDTRHQCTNGAAYSLLANSCSLPRESEQCTEKQYECNYVGQTGVWLSNSNYYYICQKDRQGDQDVFYPLMMKCSDDYSFNGHSCVPNIKFIEPSSLMTPEKAELCEELKMYPTESLHGYLLCHNGELTSYTCPVGTTFDGHSGICKPHYVD
ncbi:uncharacterized protein LOC6556406 [Drosophila grimshawi]|uniref:GH16471 n=1 Tax=Drosophila grimshawi TaxID=7222 RepID=B4J0H1_DROGR|nr:uncharacterized protein LOC6556406 [Drosophila grimshawi]EDV96807.1 GH16471 [Drosophila grimshawi]